jgi:hypothetical protein
LRSYDTALPRQLGLEFELSSDFDTLRWHRDAEWTVYPDDHIGRAQGSVRAFALGAESLIEDNRRQPQWPWAHDAISLGCRDFRSTKFHIFQTTLSNADGHGVQVISDGTQNTRAYVNDSRINLLIDDFSGGPSEGFMSHYFGKAARKQLKHDESFSGRIRLRLISP